MVSRVQEQNNTLFSSAEHKWQRKK